jgi:hypothetical protein
VKLPARAGMIGAVKSGLAVMDGNPAHALKIARAGSIRWSIG